MCFLFKFTKQRFICHECDRSFTVSTSIVDSKCSISKNTKHTIALKLCKTMSMKDIAIECSVSSNTISRVLTSYFIPKFNYKSNLSKHLLFDEFKSVKDAMSFLFIDGTNNKIGDIIIEGINNRIKVIKRVSYGYRSFINFKLKILLTFNLILKKYRN